MLGRIRIPARVIARVAVAAFASGPTRSTVRSESGCFLKETLGSSSDLLARFTETFSKNLGKIKMADLGDICLRSRPLNGTSAVEIKIPVCSLARELGDQIPLASVYKDLPKGRKRAGWKKSFLRSAQRAAADLGDITEEQILKTVREYRLGRKKPPEITVVCPDKNENGLEASSIRPSW